MNAPIGVARQWGVFCRNMKKELEKCKKVL